MSDESQAPEAKPLIVAIDWDEATYVGNEEDGCYVNTARGPDSRWYVTVCVDCNTAHFVAPLVQDDGPYDSEEEAEALESLLGLEGTAARMYFGDFSRMLKHDPSGKMGFELDGRNRRPPRDPVNALLSFAYAMLTKDFAVALGVAGLDALMGFYHQPRHGKPALALDLMEEFRPLVADSVVVGAINTGVVAPEDFTVTPVGTALKEAGRKRFIQAYERRMDQLVTHPVFGYRISYRRVLEVQARLLGRWVLSEIDAYPSFRTR